MTETMDGRESRDVFLSNVPIEVHEQLKAQAGLFEMTFADYLEKLLKLDRVAVAAVAAMAEARDEVLRAQGQGRRGA